MLQNIVLGKRREGSAGFTLIEVLVVITIIGIMVGILLPAINGAFSSAKQATVKDTLSQLETSLTLYANDHNSFPPEHPKCDSPPLVKHLEELPEAAGNSPYFDFENSKLKEKSQGQGPHFFSQFGTSHEAFEFHYAAPQADLFDDIKAGCSIPVSTNVNSHLPNLWTAGDEFDPGNSSDGIAQVNNFGNGGLSIGGGSEEDISDDQGGPQGNEGVGNGEDGSATDAVDNDGDGTGPGNPGAQGGDTNTPN